VIDKIQPRPRSSHSGDVSHLDGRLSSKVDRGQARAAGETESAEVQLSQAARDLQRIIKAAHDAPDIREDVVNQIRAQLADGTYQVDVHALARRLIQILKP
jgi:flagellar biosynthesis anti-sigma factor FlgM